MPCSLWGAKYLDEWLDAHPDPGIQALVRGMIDRLLEDPQAIEGTPVPGYRYPVYFAWVPSTDVAITYRYGIAPVCIVFLLKIESPQDL